MAIFVRDKKETNENRLSSQPLDLLAVPRGLEPLTFGLGSIGDHRRIKSRSDKYGAPPPLNRLEEHA
jgi:hypothetical protein